MSSNDLTQSVQQSQLERRWLHASQNLKAAYTGYLLPGWLVEQLSPRIRRTIRPRSGALVSGDALIALLDGEWKAAATRSLDGQMFVVTEAERALLGSPGYLSRYIRQVGNALDATRSIALLSQAYDATEEKDVKAALTAEILRISGDLLRVGAPTPQKSDFLPHSQRAVYEQLIAIGRAFFAPKPPDLHLRPRLAPLIVGPTGAGKTFLAAKAAKALGARYHKITYGDWMPLGVATEYKPTLGEILALVARHDRVVLTIDELDKWRDDFTQSWARSCSTDLWQLLDRSPSESAIADFTRKNAVDGPLLKTSELLDRLQKNLFVVGVGTWQSLHNVPSLGFGAKTQQSQTDAVARIRRQKDISEELLLRFSEILYVNYPDPQETAELYERTGLLALAERLGIALSPDTHDWTQGGMRSLEQVAARLLVHAQRQQAQQVATSAKEVQHA